MVIDTSAIAAIFFNEPEAPQFEAAIAADPRRLISAATLLEAHLVIEGRHGDTIGRELDLFFHRIAVDVMPIDRALAEDAAEAWRRWGRGHHPAGLNYGDCFAYALAVATGEPLLFKGDDFSQTDVPRVA